MKAGRLLQSFQTVLIVHYVEVAPVACPSPQDEVQIGRGGTFCKAADQESCEPFGDQVGCKILCGNIVAFDHPHAPSGIGEGGRRYAVPVEPVCVPGVEDGAGLLYR